MPIITMHAAKTNLSRLIAQALDGEEIIIARGAVPAVRLVPITQTPKRMFGALKGQLNIPDSAFAPLTGADLAAFEGDDADTP